MKHLIKIAIILTLAASLTACGANQQRGTGVGAATGAGVGAIIGQIIGQDTKGTLIGAGIGAVVGGLTGTAVGAYMDKQEEELRRMGVGVQREGDSLEATFLSDFLFDFDSAE
ncbi:MAG: hypothetical protein LBV79_01675, partial [Candidatus Adiutrix sp.]|nr:hypothetical protein [Candidatus Adiutrix sp.]